MIAVDITVLNLFVVRIRADIVLLQELISPIADVLEEIMTDYDLIRGKGYWAISFKI